MRWAIVAVFVAVAFGVGCSGSDGAAQGGDGGEATTVRLFVAERDDPDLVLLHQKSEACDLVPKSERSGIVAWCLAAFQSGAAHADCPAAPYVAAIGDRVTVRSGDGTVLATQTLRGGSIVATPESLWGCEYEFSVDLPASDFYEFEIAGETIVMSDAEVSGGIVELSL